MKIDQVLDYIKLLKIQIIERTHCMSLIYGQEITEDEKKAYRLGALSALESIENHIRLTEILVNNRKQEHPDFMGESC